MPTEFNGIERRLSELSERLARLRPFQEKGPEDFVQDVYLRDIVERNLEVAAQCCIDICHRVISMESAAKPQDYYEAIMRLGELGVIPVEFALHLTPIAGFRNILVHEYLAIDWDIVYANLLRIDDLEHFADLVRQWLRSRRADAQVEQPK